MGTSEVLRNFISYLAKYDPNPKHLRCVFTTICLLFDYNADTSKTDELLLYAWEEFTKSNFVLSFYSKYADDDRDDEYELSSDPLMARYENGFENYMLKYLI